MSGTYSTDGDVLTLDMASSGETFVMRWSLYRGRLALKRDEALGIAPTPFVMQPFRRVG